MINKKPTKNYAALKNLVIFPVVVFIFAAFSIKADVSQQTTSTVAPGPPLQLNPRRVVFEGSTKAQEIKLTNNQKDSISYKVSLINYQMDNEGSFKEIHAQEPQQKTAEKFILFTPQVVTLGPNEERTIKIQLINTEKLETGEYRSHAQFNAVQGKIVRINAEPMKLPPLYGVTIPVIIRVGESTTKVSLSDLKLEIVNDTTHRLQLTFNRTGNMSAYGDIQVNHVSPQGKITPLGSVKGIALYTPNSIRRFTMNLDKKAAVNYHSGSIHLIYSAQADAKSEKYAEAELRLQ